MTATLPKANRPVSGIYPTTTVSNTRVGMRRIEALDGRLAAEIAEVRAIDAEEADILVSRRVPLLRAAVAFGVHLGGSDRVAPNAAADASRAAELIEAYKHAIVDASELVVRLRDLRAA